MTLYDQTNITQLEHTITLQKSITSENRHKECFIVCWSGTKINSSIHQQNI